MKLLIFTDLDGTLLNQDDYRYEAAIPVLEELKTRQIPVVPVTSKTRQEVETLRQEIKLEDPFIVENGSAIFVPLDSQQFVLDRKNEWEGYHLELLGCTYAQVRAGLMGIGTFIEESLRGFGDLSEREIEQLTGLSSEGVKQAKAREFTEPFVIPDRISSDRLQQVVEDFGFRVVVGDRFSHLIGSGAGKGKAVQWLKQHYASNPQDRLITIGLGNSPNDLEMLKAVDIAIVVPGNKGVHPRLRGRGWQVAPATGSQGWASAIATQLSKIDRSI
ncbi:HAD-IIB family hydrolase [Candidatus Gracilibacteria bacterium]|nr:HAD-IIB family hydrolase [Candidatus Gracilibacteria bacterium]NJP21333.1 HAD-IIB family hydrolase [Hydrococcus sp. CRU_1_1]